MKGVLPALAFAALALPLGALDFAPLLVGGSGWQQSRRDWERALAGSRYAPVDAQSIRLLAEPLHSFGALRPREIEMQWAEDGSALSSVRIIIYNKGDDLPLDKKAFAANLKDSMAALSEALGGPGRQKALLTRDTGVKVKATEWRGEHIAARLEACNQEFIRLTMAADAGGLGGGGAADAVSKKSLRQNVCREGGALWIKGIPMVDQGEKGYCVPATLARMFGYYGMSGIDQHAMAALCESGGTTGTSVLDMQRALEAISHRFHVRLSQVDAQMPDLQAVYARYNRAAAAAGQPMLQPMPAGRNLSEADGRLMQQAMGLRDADIAKWLKPIRKPLQDGIPILWCVPGHMRMIIGYDTDRQELIYSDSWGQRTAEERMPLSAACAISVFRYILKPSR
ncbi:MAG: hypothetical protein ACI4OS_06370 [Akkermansia sp.]